MESSSQNSTASADVIVLACNDDDAVAEEIRVGLADMGLAVSVGERDRTEPTSVKSAVVLLSTAALTSTWWRRKVDQYRGCQLVPVIVGEVDADAVDQPSLTELNWIKWAEGASIGALVDIFIALTSDLGLYHRYRALRTQTRAWESGGRTDAHLILNVHRARTADRLLRDAESDPRTISLPAVREFVAQSLRRAKGRRRQRRLLLGTALAVILGLVAIVGFVIQKGLWFEQNTKLDMLTAMNLFQNDVGPARSGLLAGATMIQGTAEDAALARPILRLALDERWPVSYVGQNTNGGMADAVVSSDGRHLLAVDRIGTLARWDTTTGNMTWRRKVSSTYLNYMDATDDWRRVVVADGDSVHIITVEPWHRIRVRVPNAPKAVALAPEAGIALVATVNGSLYSVNLNDGETRQVGSFAKVLDLRRVEGGNVRVLVVAHDGTLVLADAATARTVRAWPTIKDVLAGSLGLDGSSVGVVDAGLATRYGVMTGELLPTGMMAPPTVGALAVLGPGLLGLSTDEFGLRIWEARSGVVTARTGVSPISSPLGLRAGQGGHYVTIGGMIAAVWDTTGLSPVSNPTADDLLEGESADVTVIGATDGVVTVQTAGNRQVLRPVRVAITATSVAPDGRSALVGDANGGLVQLDLSANGAPTVRRWSAPDGGPILAVAWSATPGRLLIQSGHGLWWSPESCDGCGHDDRILAVLRARTRGCLLNNNVDRLTEATRASLGVQLCAKVPEPEAG